MPWNHGQPQASGCRSGKHGARLWRLALADLGQDMGRNLRSSPYGLLAGLLPGLEITGALLAFLGRQAVPYRPRLAVALFEFRQLLPELSFALPSS